MSNVVLLMSDSHNPLVSSVYGHPFVQTPNMDRLASMGVVYENAYCPSPICVPCRSAFMTGRPVHQIRTFNNCKVIPGDHPSYGGVLAEQGVHTTWVGSHANLYRDPFELGFREMLLVKRTKPRLATDFARDPLPMRRPGALNRNYGPRDDAWASSIQQVDAAVDWLHETAPGLDAPWTLTVNVHPPHSPLWARPAFWDMYDGKGDSPTYGPEADAAQHPYVQSLREFYATDEISPEDIRGMRQGYYACVSYVDRELGRLLNALEATGQLGDTVVVYVSDHGEMLGKFGVWWKSSLHEDSVRVPLVVAGPGFQKGARVRTPVSLLDLQAAIFRAVGKRRPESWWGEPLQDVPVDDPERFVFSEYHGHGVPSGAFMIRRGHWKLMYNMAAPHQLYNIQDDPDELHNRWNERQDIARELEHILRSICDPEAVNDEAHAFERRQLAVIREMNGE